MDKFTVVFWVIGGILFIISLGKNKEKTMESMKKSRGMMKNMLGNIIGIIFLIGLILTFVPPHSIEEVMGSHNTLLSSLIASIVGSITLIPAFAAFPLVGSFVDAGASIVPGVAFLTTLTMVGIVTFPLEQRELGTKFAVTRNLLSFGAAISIAVLMGVILS